MKCCAKLTVLFVVIVVAGCSFAKTSTAGYACESWINTFYQKPLARQISTFANHDVNDQYRIYICGNQVVHPPATYLASPFAEQGVYVVPLLVTKLREAKDDLTIRDILLVFAEMERQRSYMVSTDKALMKLMQRKVDGMEDAGWKSIAQANVDRILRGN